MADFDLTGIAKQDLREIGRYTEQAWGAGQAKKYLRTLEMALETLSAIPKAGRPRNEIAAEVRSFEIGRHIAYYKERDGGITVVRILHPRMEPGRRIEQAFAPKSGPDS